MVLFANVGTDRKIQQTLTNTAFFLYSYKHNKKRADSMEKETAPSQSEWLIMEGVPLNRLWQKGVFSITAESRLFQIPFVLRGFYLNTPIL